MKQKLLILGLLGLGVACGSNGGGSNSSAQTSESSTEGGGRALPIEDDFSDPASGWSVSDDENDGAAYRDGRLVVWIDNDARGYVVGDAALDVNAPNVVVEVTAEFLSGSDSASVGIMCRHSGAGRYFADVDGSGDVRIGSYQEEQRILAESTWLGLHDGQHRLRFTCDGERLELAIDGEIVASATDDRLSAGAIKLLVGGAGSGFTEVAFDDFVARAP